jgi:hypothetical protein
MAEHRESTWTWENAARKGVGDKFTGWAFGSFLGAIWLGFKGMGWAAVVGFAVLGVTFTLVAIRIHEAGETNRREPRGARRPTVVAGGQTNLKDCPYFGTILLQHYLRAHTGDLHPAALEQ